MRDETRVVVDALADRVASRRPKMRTTARTCRCCSLMGKLPTRSG